MNSVELTIEAVVAGGDGLAHHEGRAVFVPGALPGDCVEAELAQVGGAVRGRILALRAASPARVEPGCPHVERCGGCPWLALGYAAQLRAKERIFYDALARIGGLGREAFDDARPIVGSPSALHYRARTKLHVAGGRLGYAGRASHKVEEVTECRLLEPTLEAALLRLQAAVAQQGAPPRCTDVSLACDAQGRVAAAFHLAAGGSPRAAMERIERLTSAARLDGAVVAVPGAPARALGRPLLSWPAPLAPGVVLYGRPDLFAQANAAANAALVATAREGLAGAGARVLELFAGAGNFTFAAAAAGAQVTAAEIAGDSLELARRSAREAGAGLDVRFIAGDALEVARGLAREGARFDALLLDPPRTGARGVGAAAAALHAARVVYVSCNPATLARDARELIAAGYRPRSAIPVDMFPQTSHVEGVLLLERA